MAAQETLVLHEAAEQAMPEAHFLPHPPQLAASVSGLTHLPLQQRKVAPEHLVPQAPQLL